MSKAQPHRLYRFRGGNFTAEIRCIGQSDDRRYTIVRRPGAGPFLITTKEWLALPLAESEAK